MIPTKPPHRRASRPGARRSLAVLAAAALLVSGPAVRPARAYPEPNVNLVGHGFGHGRGMGQFGALGYALAGWPDTQILDHYYGGTSMGNVGNPGMSVRVLGLDNRDTIVVQERAQATTSAVGGSFQALRVHLVAPNLFEVYSGSGCQGGPAGWGAPIATVAGPVVLASALPQGDDHTNMLQVCQPDGAGRWYRGDFLVLDGGGSRTVNRVDMDGYLRGVVPRESPASWGTLGDGRGMHALRAQAVAARSYAQAQSRYPYAKTCDTETCQVYGGFALQDGSGYRDLEAASTSAAVLGTAGLVRVTNGSGAVASTEFSSSTGGFTAGGTFPAVVDAGDETPSNPNHTWTASVPVVAIEAAFPVIGSLRAVDVTRRNGLGDLGGRVLDVALRGTAGTQVLSGNDFRRAFGLKSDWFAVTNNIGGGTDGYWVVAADGGVFAFGAARFHGSTGAIRLNRPVVGMAATPSGGGYWLVASDGGIFAFGNAPFFGSTGAIRLNQPVVGMAASPSGGGYWLVARDGGVFAFGDAPFQGSTGAIRLNQPMVGMAATPSGRGYWLVAADGGVFAFGDARFLGSTGAIRLNQPMVATAATPSGNGYWLVAADGGIFAFGDAAFHGSLPGIRAAGPARGIQGTSSGNGYLVATEAGRVHSFGDAPYYGDVVTAIPGYRGGVRGLAAKRAG